MEKAAIAVETGQPMEEVDYDPSSWTPDKAREALRNYLEENPLKVLFSLWNMKASIEQNDPAKAAEYAAGIFNQRNAAVRAIENSYVGYYISGNDDGTVSLVFEPRALSDGVSYASIIQKLKEEGRHVPVKYSMKLVVDGKEVMLEIGSIQHKDGGSLALPTEVKITGTPEALRYVVETGTDKIIEMALTNMDGTYQTAAMNFPAADMFNPAYSMIRGMFEATMRLHAENILDELDGMIDAQQTSSTAGKSPDATAFRDSLESVGAGNRETASSGESRQLTYATVSEENETEKPASQDGQKETVAPTMAYHWTPLRDGLYAGQFSITNPDGKVVKGSASMWNALGKYVESLGLDKANKDVVIDALKDHGVPYLGTPATMEVSYLGTAPAGPYTGRLQFEVTLKSDDGKLNQHYILLVDANPDSKTYGRYMMVPVQQPAKTG